jgi:2-polyprenyl-3-methyl-5-hydroxy-6-metoxy-1,4-benzoquinol methylase
MSTDAATDTAIDSGRVDAFVQRFVGDLATAMHLPTVLIGDRLGLYEAMADGAPVTAEELADRTGTDERYLTEWLSAQAAAGYLDYDGSAFRLPREHAMFFVDGAAPVFVPGAYQVAAAAMKAEATVTDAFRTGRGVGWHEHDPELFVGTDRFFRAGYAAHLVSEWLPALDGVVADLERGVPVADVGCGQGASTVLMARAFPRSRFVGSDYHAPSIEAARQAAHRAGVGDRCTFEVASAQDFGGTGYRLVTSFDCLHDMGDPVGAARHVREALAPDGTWLLVEPAAGDRLEDNLNPVGAVFYSASTLICTPASRSQEVGRCLGAQAGPARLAEVAGEAGFTRFRRATGTPFNDIYEVRA